MASFAATSLRRLRGLFAPRAHERPQSSDSAVVLDGVSAVATVEAGISAAAALAANYPAAAAARVWSSFQRAAEPNRFGEMLTSVAAQSPRGALAAALGMAMSGQRATVFLAGCDLVATQDLLAHAAGQHLPLVVHLACRAPAGHAQALGSGHESYMAACDSGFALMFAANVQEAVDLTLVARRVSESALVPVIVAMDGEQTAAAAQNVSLPAEGFVREYLGAPSQLIEPPTPSQRLLFGDARRRVPRSYDLDRPMMLSPLQDPTSWAYGAAGARPFFDSHLDALLHEAGERFTRDTGRSCSAVAVHRIDGAEIVLVAQGAAVESATAVADWLRDNESLRVGVVGIRCLRPLPGPQIAACLAGVRTVAVLERVDAPLGGDGPLLRELRTVLGRAGDNARFDDALHSGYPAIGDHEQPRLVSVVFGVGGLPLRSVDMIALVRELAEPRRSLVYLGLDFARPATAYPKRQALMDTLRRSYAGLAELGLRAAEQETVDVRAPGTTTIAVHRLSGDDSRLAGEAAALIHETAGGELRCRPATTWQRFDWPCTEYLVHGRAPLRDPGDDAPVDIAVVACSRVGARMDVAARLAAGGALLLADEKGSRGPWLPEQLRRELEQRRIGLYRVEIAAGDGGGRAAAWQRREALLAGLLALFVERVGAGAVSAGKVRAAREAGLSELDAGERERRLDAFADAFASVEAIGLEANTRTGGDEADPHSETPFALRHMDRNDGTLDCLARFWGEVGVVYQQGEIEELSVDPYLATGAVPQLSATLREVGSGREIMLAFDAESCDGDGRAWTSCPDASVAPVVISPKALIDTAISLASARGETVDPVRAVASKLARRVVKMVEAGGAPTTAGELLGEAFAHVSAGVTDGERKAALEEAFSVVVAEVGELALVRTESFFDDAERVSRGSGELFALVVNPDACKSPELILAACQGRGLKAVERTSANVAASRRLWRLWQQLPDTPGSTIERTREHPQVGPLAAMMLSRHCQLVMAAGDGSEAGSGAKLALRQVLAAAEYQLQPRLQDYLTRIEDLRSKLAGCIHEVLADALPGGDLDALAAGLDLLGERDFDLPSLSAKVDSAVAGGRVDGARLRRLVDVARGLADLHWQLAKGADGLGRARAGVAIAPGGVASWAGVFPYNSFATPVAVDASGETGPLAAGLVAGQVAQALDGVRLVRWAELEIDKPGEAPHTAKELARLGFTDLSSEERRLCPPVLVVGDGRAFAGSGLSHLVWLLDSGLPVKIVVLGEIGGDADGGLGVDALGAYPAAERRDLALLALLGREAFVAQTSIARRDHLARSVLAALAFDGPALLHIHAPSPQRHGFAVERLYEQAEMAVASHAFPLFVFDPSGEGVFGSCIDLSGNAGADATAAGDRSGLTPIEWLASESRFAEHFAPLGADDAEPIPAAEYLELSLHQRAGKTPYVAVKGRYDEEERLRVDHTIIADADYRMRLWRTLQELAGVVTPFTEQVRAAAESDVADAHAAELARLRDDFDVKNAALRAAFEEEAVERVSGGLMSLAGYPPYKEKSQ